MHSLRIMRSVSFLTCKEWFAYRSQILLSIIIGPVFFLINYFIWNTLLATKGSINGFTLDQILIYYGVVTCINYLIMDFSGTELQGLISSGQYITYMLKPISHKYYAFSQKIGQRLIGFVFEFIPIICIFIYVFRIPLFPEKPILLVISIIFSFLIMFFINYCIGLTSFWLIKSDGIMRLCNLIRDICAGVFIPLVFFPAIVQKILFFLPFQFIVYVPIRVFIGNYELAGFKFTIQEIVSIQAVYVILMWILSELLLRLGIRKFTGVGA